MLSTRVLLLLAVSAICSFYGLLHQQRLSAPSAPARGISIPLTPHQQPSVLASTPTYIFHYWAQVVLLPLTFGIAHALSVLIVLALLVLAVELHLLCRAKLTSTRMRL